MDSRQRSTADSAELIHEQSLRVVLMQSLTVVLMQEVREAVGLAKAGWTEGDVDSKDKLKRLAASCLFQLGDKAKAHQLELAVQAAGFEAGPWSTSQLECWLRLRLVEH